MIRPETPVARQGIWKLDYEEPLDSATEKSLLWHVVFVCHADGTLSVQLLSLSPAAGQPEDGAYRVEGSWRGDTLFYRLPNQVEVELATFVDGHFETEGDGLRRVYRRAQPSELLPPELPLLDAKRAVWR